MHISHIQYIYIYIYTYIHIDVLSLVALNVILKVLPSFQ